MKQHLPEIPGSRQSKFKSASTQKATLPIDSQDIFSEDPAVKDEELRQAIKQLEASTANIERQTVLLKRHQASLSSLFHERKSKNDVFNHAITALEKKWMHESQQLAFVSEDLTSETTSTFRSLGEHATSTTRSVSSVVTAQLNAHDRMLEAMDTAEGEISKAEPNEKYSISRVEKLTSILASLSQQEIRCRLDRTYLEAVNDSGAISEDGASVEDHEEAITSLEASIPPLFSEINAVAEMSANHAYRDPLIRAITKQEHHIASQAALRQNDIANKLGWLTDSAEDTANRLLQLHAFRITLSEMQGLAAERKEVDSVLSPSKQTKLPHLSDLRHERRALETLLQNLNVPTANLTPSILTSQASKISNAIHALESDLHSSITSHLANDKRMTTTLQDACNHANDTSNHEDEGPIDEQIDDLSVRVGEVGKWIERLGSKVDAMSQDKDKARDTFLERWAGS